MAVTGAKKCRSHDFYSGKPRPGDWAFQLLMSVNFASITNLLTEARITLANLAKTQHPNDLGYQVMANSIDLDLLNK
jgi:hypothetical protein